MADTYEPSAKILSNVEFNYAQYESIWPSAANLRDSGMLLQSFRRITCPVVAIHGDYDPHPAMGVTIPLSDELDDFKFFLLEHCGHYPWIEKTASEQFYEILISELLDRI